MNLIFKIFIIVNFAVSTLYAADICPELESKLENQGLLTNEDRIYYCAARCTFLQNFRCDKERKERSFPKIFKDMLNAINRTRTVTYTRRSYGDVEFAFDNNWWDLLEFCLPFLLAVIPVVVSHTKLDYSMKVVFYLFWGIGSLTVDMDWMLSIYNIVTVVFCLTVPERSQAAATVIVNMMVFLTAIIFAVAYRDFWVQLGLGLFSMVYFSTILYRVIQKGNITDYPAFFIALIQFLGLGRMIYLLMVYRAVDSIQLRMIQFITEAVLPLGPDNSLWSNAFLDTVWVIADLRLLDTYAYWFMAFFMTFWSLFLGVRGLIGVILIKRLRIKVDLRSFWIGLYVYMADFFGGFHYFARILFGFEVPSFARTSYAVIHLVLFVREFVGAREFLLLRFMISIIDYALWDGGYSKVPKYAEGKIDLSGMSFPKDGSFPWFSIEKMSGLAASVKRIKGYCGASIKSGVGLIVRDERGMVGLYTARHVLEDCDSFMIGTERSDVSGLVNLGKSSDPVIFTKLSDDSEGAELSVLTREEISEVKFLFSIHCDGMVNMIKDFKFQRDGDISCAVNIMQGDSGSPVVAVLSEGSLRYAGAVSRGSFDEGTGNLISSVTASVERGSPGVATNYIDVVRQEEEAFQTALEIVEQTLKDVKQCRDPPEEHESKSKGKRRKDRVKHYRETMEMALKYIKDETLCENIRKAFDDNEVISFNQIRLRRPVRQGLGYF